MGVIYLAECTNCDFNSRFQLGGSRKQVGKVQSVPAINKASNTFENPNLLEVEDFLQYKFYWEEGMYLQSQESGKILLFEHEFQDAFNLCPACNKYFLFFRSVIHFD